MINACTYGAQTKSCLVLEMFRTLKVVFSVCLNFKTMTRTGTDQLFELEPSLVAYNLMCGVPLSGRPN